MKTYAQQQAEQLIETGQCHFAIDWHNVVHAATRHPRFDCALSRAYRGEVRALRIILNATAHKLCMEFDSNA